MNEEIKVIKIKKEYGKELDVNWILDLGNRCNKKSNIASIDVFMIRRSNYPISKF